MKKKIIMTVAVLLAASLIFPSFVFADGLVPCGGPGEDDCTLCHFFEMIKNIMEDFILTTAFVAISAMLAVGGIKYFLSGGNEGEIKKAKSVLTGAVWGFAIIMTSWLVVNSVLVAMGYAEANIGMKSINNQFIMECESE